ncbi:type III-A CRISPR-associated protein Csm2 [Desulfonema magnum]|uniref:CRISPR system Cms protein Csm2 n=1 Tax=Desulfonema magnum TaxID=45655 RepID=A0A975BVH3_9BACT|nr:type III-A CRISPR-associated protein Csm2 [Desulfonema magnum]QTA91974.1 CRISPR type III-A/MTUBE-associated protein [Desulfonema magnum]
MRVADEIKAHFDKNKNHQFGDVPASTIVKWAESCKFKERQLTPTQMRRFYDAIRGVWDDPKMKNMADGDKLEEMFLARLIFLRPAFAGAVRKNKIPPAFKEIMDQSIQKVKKKKDMYKFVKFFEAIIQYAE